MIAELDLSLLVTNWLIVSRLWSLQSALKLKQKMLKEDWEFFKAQRKILEDHVAKNSKSPVSHR